MLKNDFKNCFIVIVYCSLLKELVLEIVERPLYVNSDGA